MTNLRAELCQNLAKWCQGHVEPHMEHDDEAGKFRMEIFQGLGEQGYTGITVSEDFGGAGLSYADYVAVLEEMAKYSVAYAVTVSVSNMVQTILENYGNNAQKEKYLPALTAGTEIGAFALS